VDIINYDAYNYLETIFYFEQDLKRFISRGGRIAPGIVPSDEGITAVTPVDMEHLIDKFRNMMIEKGGSQGLRDLIITTSCGVGSLQPAEARRAMELLRGIASNVNL
jgi:hypothetical protein